MSSSPFDREPIRDSAELKRILELPRRRWQEGYQHPIEELQAQLTYKLRRPGSEMLLRPVQAAILAEAYYCGGAFGPIGVGDGKTLPSFLLAKVLGSKRPLLLIPANLREKTMRDYEELQRHWYLPELRIENYELLSRENASQYLQNYAPDLIVADEAHKMKNPSSAITRRVARYLREAPTRPAVVLLSGTFTHTSIMDYWHLLRWCLGDDRCPLPKDWSEAFAWADALDVAAKDDSPRTPPGALVKLCDTAETNAVATGQSNVLDALRSGYRRRLTQTPGVVSTESSSTGQSILIECEALYMPQLNEHFLTLRRDWQTPDGHDFETPVELWRHTRELTCGFYYRWNPRPPLPWMEARRAWSKFAREVLKHSRKLDTEYQVRLAVMDGRLPAGAAILAEWQAQEPTFTPNQEPVWIDDTTLRYCAAWLSKRNGLCWVEHRAFGERLSHLTGLPYYGEQGKNAAGGDVQDEKGACILSIAANHQGHNLQRYSENLVASVPGNGKVWEQLIGRTHRPGQKADLVRFTALTNCAEQLGGFYRAVERAHFVEQSEGRQQKLCLANIMQPKLRGWSSADQWLWYSPRES